MILPSGLSTYDYSISAAQKGWGEGWPACTAGPIVVVITPTEGARLPVHARLARLISLLVTEIERRGYIFVAGWCWGYACRSIAGTKRASNHSWAQAIDINAPTNSYNSTGVHDIPDWVFALFRAFGFGVGADYSGSQDWMHVEFMGTPEDADIMTALAERAFGNGEDMTPEEHGWLAEVRFAMVANLVGPRVAAIDARTAAISTAVGLIQADLSDEDMEKALARLQAVAANTPAWRVESNATDPEQKRDEEAAVWVLVVIDDTSHRYHVPGRAELAAVWGVDVNSVTRLPATHPLASLPVWPTTEES